jgi:hypothetical protein
MEILCGLQRISVACRLLLNAHWPLAASRRDNSSFFYFRPLKINRIPYLRFYREILSLYSTIENSIRCDGNQKLRALNQVDGGYAYGCNQTMDRDESKGIRKDARLSLNTRSGQSYPAHSSGCCGGSWKFKRRAVQGNIPAPFAA